MKKPNLFVIGAPKCGTTSLCEYLSAHPNIIFSNPKEPNYFCSDITGEYCSASNENDYLAHCFPKDADKYTIVGDGSVSSLYSKDAVKNILLFNPDAQFIVMLRNPIELVYSLHGQLLLNGQEDVYDFIQAWRLQDKRKNGEYIPNRCSMPDMLNYGDVGKIGVQLERLCSQVSPKQVIILLLDDMIADPVGEYKKALKFLSLPEYIPESFPIANESQRRKFKYLEQLVWTIANLKKYLNIKTSFGILTAISQSNIKLHKRVPLPPKFTRELSEFFLEDVKSLSLLIDRDCTHWTLHD